VKTVSGKVVRHPFIGLTILAKMISGGRPLPRENLAHPLSKRRFLIYFRP